MNWCGRIEFGGYILNVYDSLEEPLFKATEVARLIDYSAGNTYYMLDLVEDDEKVMLPESLVAGNTRDHTHPPRKGSGKSRNSITSARGGNRKPIWFITELGLYNVLSQSRKPIARGWRRIVHQELIRLRQSRGKNVIEQFDDWDEELDDIWFDEETGHLMQSVTLPGGDVDQIIID